MKTLLITPPLVQPNTPYAATPLLAAWLRAKGCEAVQADLSLELLLKLFCRDGITQLFQRLEQVDEAAAFLEQKELYLDTIEPVLAFLQGKTETPELELPEGPYLARAREQEEQLQWNFRGLDETDRMRYLCSLYLDDIAEAARLHDPHFGFSRYGDHLSVSVPSFEQFRDQLSADTLFTEWLDELTEQAVSRHRPNAVALTVPFPGCLFGALRIARRIRQVDPKICIAIGGGYVSTELRELSDPGIFDWIDFVCLDSGMRPLQQIAKRRIPGGTLVRKNGAVCFSEEYALSVSHDSLPAPVYDGLPLDEYFGLFEVLNPVTRLWSDGRWNKLVLAHGCCWRRCAFCDTSVDCISRYDSASPQTIGDWLESVMEQTEVHDFHFVDEALPPDLIDGLCDEILRRSLNVEWWGNIRLEPRFSNHLIQKMAAAGCIAVTGGLETCCDRTLRLMRKGITVSGAKTVLHRLADAGILTHAYLMYGFPTQTFEETVGAMETVRSLVDSGVLNSVYWHRFALTAHSDISRNPEHFGIRLLPEIHTGFARNEIPFDGGFDYDLDAVGEALKTAAYNWQLGIGLERPVQNWFEKTADL